MVHLKTLAVRATRPTPSGHNQELNYKELNLN